MRLVAILLWLCIPPVAAEQLMDSGYGDGAVVSESGYYYLPQPDGSYMDADGNTLIPDEPGRLVGPLGETFELSPDTEAFGNTPWKSQTAEAEPGSSVQTPKTGPSGEIGDIEEAMRQGIYMDVGTGYLDIGSPNETPTDRAQAPPAWRTPATSPPPLRNDSAESIEIPNGLTESDSESSIQDALEERLLKGHAPAERGIRDPFRPYSNPDGFY